MHRNLQRVFGVFFFLHPLIIFSLFVSVTETVLSSELSSGRAEGDDEEQALLERLAKREERRQRRMKEALDRQKQESDDAPSYSSYSMESSSTSTYRAFNNQEEEPAYNSKEEVKDEVYLQKEAMEVCFSMMACSL